MKKNLLALLTSIALAVSFTGCSSKKNSGNNSAPPDIQNQSVQHQNDENCENAFRELFTSLYTQNGGETFYMYMYPNAALEKIKELGEYKGLIETYNNNQNQFVNDIKHIPEITEFTSITPLSQTQIEAAKRYFSNLVSNFMPDLKAEDIKITEGYEIKCDIINYNDKADSDIECMVKLEGEGWKAITYSADTLEKNFPAETT